MSDELFTERIQAFASVDDDSFAIRLSEKKPHNVKKKPKVVTFWHHFYFSLLFVSQYFVQRNSALQYQFDWIELSWNELKKVFEIQNIAADCLKYNLRWDWLPPEGTIRTKSKLGLRNDRSCFKKRYTEVYKNQERIICTTTVEQHFRVHTNQPKKNLRATCHENILECDVDSNTWCWTTDIINTIRS